MRKYSDDKKAELRKEMLIAASSDNSMAVTSIFAACCEISRCMASGMNREKSRTLKTLTNMCMQSQRNMTMLDFLELAPERARRSRVVIKCRDFVQKFAEKCSEFLPENTGISFLECGEWWIETNEQLLEYSLLGFVRRCANQKLNNITISCVKKDKKITIKLLAEGNLKKKKDILDDIFTKDKIYFEMSQYIALELLGAECTAFKSSFSVSFNEKEHEGNIVFREPAGIVRSSTFTPYSIMLSDTSNYRFF